ncbi:MAG TPA: MBL fold metallo-hydrolase [Campylobacterales bacterium]|nr:MBL fold metallo-hydrolase [Campylobacterales bacterium]
MILNQNFNSINIGAIKVTSIGVQHGGVPAIAYTFEIDGKKIVFSGDTSANSENIIKLARDADYLIAHHAIPQHSGKFAKRLHMTPKRIGEVAKKANVKHLILSHRMKRTHDKENESEKLIRENFNGEIIWAEDLMKVEVK